MNLHCLVPASLLLFPYVSQVGSLSTCVRKCNWDKSVQKCYNANCSVPILENHRFDKPKGVNFFLRALEGCPVGWWRLIWAFLGPFSLSHKQYCEVCFASFGRSFFLLLWLCRPNYVCLPLSHFMQYCSANSHRSERVALDDPSYFYLYVYGTTNKCFGFRPILILHARKALKHHEFDRPCFYHPTCLRNKLAVWVTTMWGHKGKRKAQQWVRQAIHGKINQNNHLFRISEQWVVAVHLLRRNDHRISASYIEAYSQLLGRQIEKKKCMNYYWLLLMRYVRLFIDFLIFYVRIVSDLPETC